MEFTLVSGRFTAGETEELVNQLVKVKSDFHLKKMAASPQSDEATRHSERRLAEIQAKMQEIMNMIGTGGYKHVGIYAKLTLEFCPDYHNV